MPISESKKRIQEVIAKLVGVWYRTKDRNDKLKETFWHYDGKNCWYTVRNDWVLYPSEFSVARMDAMDVFERIPDPRPK